MAIVYLTRTAAEIEADRRADLERDAWGELRYTEYRIGREASLTQWRRSMALKLSPDYAKTGRLSDIGMRYLSACERRDITTHEQRMAYYHRKMAECADLIARCKPYTAYVPLADDELPF